MTAIPQSPLIAVICLIASHKARPGLCNADETPAWDAGCHNLTFLLGDSN